MLHLLTFVLLTASIIGTPEGRRSSMEFDESLGTGFDISRVKIGSSVLTKGSTIFKRISSHCIRGQTLEKSRQTFSYFENTADLVKTFQVSAGLTPSFLSFVSLKNSLSGTFSKVNRAEKKVSGAMRKFYTYSRRDYLDKKCRLQLDDEFERDFKALKKTVVNPHLTPSWDEYKYFLQKYGSHYVTRVNYGASVTQYLSAESSLKYSKQNFSTRACLELAGPVHVGVAKAELCGGISKADENTARSFQIDHKLVVLGGSDSTRNKIIQNPNLDRHYITMLLDEGRNHESPILYRFSGIADLLMRRYHKTEFASQAANFKSYLEGFLNFDCVNRRDKYGLLELQKFELVANVFTEYPQYKCTIAAEGCRNNSDCHWKGTCKCHGDTCVRYDQLSAWYGKTKTTATINNGTSPGVVNKYCRYTVSWRSRCTCNRPPYTNERQVVWRSTDQPSILLKAAAIINKYFKTY